MKYANEARAEGVPVRTGEILYEAMPWLKQVTGKTIVIKYGGSAMENPELAAEVMADIVLLKILGVNPVLVHGGGKAINRAFSNFNLPVEFIDGQRVTTDDAMDLVRMVLTGEVNQQLVEAMNAHGNMGVGVSGTDAGIIVAEQARPELGRVGKITRINTQLIEDLVADDYIPIIASIAIGEDGGCYNVNADVAAGYIAAAIGAHKIIFLTDVDGLYENYPDPDSLIAEMTLGEAEAMVRGDKLSSGMIPKLSSCVRALDSGVSAAHIINGTVPHALLLELLTDSEEAGVHIIASKNGRQFFVTGHGEYDADTLEKEYLRDVNQGKPIAPPVGYYPGGDTTQRPVVSWRAHANLLYGNWLNFVYQETPYHLEKLFPVRTRAK